jgi:copper(I)-binding protein
MMRSMVFAALLCPTFALADSVAATDAIVPLAPKGVMVHAAYMSLTNTASQTRSLIGVQAPAYAMAHLHQSIEKDGIATMSAMHQLDIKPGQTVTLKPGGMHVMLMKPSAALELGEAVALELEFADGTTLPVSATVVRFDGSS